MNDPQFRRAQLRKAATEIDGLDPIMEGGLPVGRPTLLCGAAGCGKTLFGVTFLAEGSLNSASQASSSPLRSAPRTFPRTSPRLATIFLVFSLRKSCSSIRSKSSGAKTRKAVLLIWKDFVHWPWLTKTLLQAAPIFARLACRQANTRMVSSFADLQNLRTAGAQAARSCGVPCC